MRARAPVNTEPTGTAAVVTPSAERHPDWRRFLASVAVSRTADLVYAVALVVHLIEETDSAAWVAASVTARIAAFMAFSPIGGVLADRFDRRRVLTVVDLFRSTLMAGSAVVIGIGGPPAAVIVLISASAAVSTAYRPAMIGATTLMVPEDQLAAANAAHATIGQFGWFLGPALGTAIVAAAGPAAGFAVTATAFAVAAFLVHGVAGVQPRHGSGNSEAALGFLRQFADGAGALRRLPGVLSMMLLFVAVYFAFGIEQVVQVLVARDRLGLDAGGVGLLTASMGAGGLVAVPFARRLAGAANAGALLALSGVLLGAPLVLLTVTTRPLVAVGLMVVEGIGNILLDVVFVTMLQRACPEALLGRIFAMQVTAGALAQLAGTIAAPVMTGMFTLEAAMLIGGGSLVALSLLLHPQLQAISRRTQAERERLAPIAARLGALGILGQASLAARERIARSATTVTVPAGSVVFTEGDVPTDLFIITSGMVKVSTTEQGEVRTLGPDTWFGEIGLLRGIPRTASISALEATELLVIPGGLFLDAVTAEATLPDPLMATLRSRLARTHPHLERDQSTARA